MAIQNPFDTNAKPTAAGPTAMNVKPEATTAGQLNTLLASDSPYLAQARARAAQQSNARGLINSTMGVQAGEAAAIDAALPIAQSDANTFFTADQFNATNENQFVRDENMFNRDDYLQNQQRDFTAGQADLDRQQQSTLLGRELSSVEARQKEQLKTQVDLAKLDSDLRTNLLDKQIASEKDLTEMRAKLQQTQSALEAKLRDEAALFDVTRGRNANIDQSLVQMGQNYLSAVERIMTSNVPPEAQPALINQLRAQYQDQINFATSLRNLTVLAAGQAGV